MIKRIIVLVVISLLSACSGIPTMVPDMAFKSTRTVQLENAQGPLSTKQSKAILTKLKKNGDDTNIFDKHLALESEIVGSPLVVGNKVDLLVDGTATYNAMLEAIENAKDHINMETYIFEAGEVGQFFAKKLIQKQTEGVQVNLIYDSVGSSETPKDFFKTLTDSGINVLEYNPINPLKARKSWEFNERDHRKLLIIDGETAFVGGINISSVYASGSFGGSRFSRAKNTPDTSGKAATPWRDTHLKIVGAVVSDFQKLFLATWATQKGAPLAIKNYYPDISTPDTTAPSSAVNTSITPANLKMKGNEIVRAIGSSPDEPYSQIYVTLLSAINSAETQISITNAYFVPDPQLLTALKDAVARGVDVRLLLPEKTDSTLVFYASRSFYDELLSAGVKIYERKDALLHAKTALIDGVWSTIGSTNLDWRSFTNNQEINAVILSQGFSDQMHALFEKDLTRSTNITLSAWRQRSITERIKERTARLWARLL